MFQRKNASLSEKIKRLNGASLLNAKFGEVFLVRCGSLMKTLNAPLILGRSLGAFAAVCLQVLASDGWCLRVSVCNFAYLHFTHYTIRSL